MTSYFVHRTSDNKILKKDFKMLFKAKEFKTKLDFLFPLEIFAVGKTENGETFFNIKIK